MNVAHPEEAAQILLASRGRRLLEPKDLFVLHLQLPPAHNKAQILHLLLEQVPLLGLKEDARATKLRENLPEEHGVLSRRQREYNDVVEVHQVPNLPESHEDDING